MTIVYLSGFIYTKSSIGNVFLRHLQSTERLLILFSLVARLFFALFPCAMEAFSSSRKVSIPPRDRFSLGYVPRVFWLRQICKPQLVTTMSLNQQFFFVFFLCASALLVEYAGSVSIGLPVWLIVQIPK